MSGFPWFAAAGLALLIAGIAALVSNARAAWRWSAGRTGDLFRHIALAARRRPLFSRKHQLTQAGLPRA
jgi:hypothetical protein